jgi:hypothetical protein
MPKYPFKSELHSDDIDTEIGTSQDINDFKFLINEKGEVESVIKCKNDRAREQRKVQRRFSSIESEKKTRR